MLLHLTLEHGDLLAEGGDDRGQGADRGGAGGGDRAGGGQLRGAERGPDRGRLVGPVVAAGALERGVDLRGGELRR
jgi:hypothetical protein